MKLEALWSLTNIAYGDDSVVEKMLIECAGQFDDVYYSLDIGLLQICSNMMQTIRNEGYQDIKTLNILYQLINNLCGSNQEICVEIVNKTIVVDSLVGVVQTQNKIEAELFENMLFVMRTILLNCDLD